MPGESLGQAFLRRLKKDDLCYPVYAEYVKELDERWKSAAKEISFENAKSAIKDIEIKYKLECEAQDELLMEIPEIKADVDRALESPKNLLSDEAMKSLADQGIKISHEEVRQILGSGGGH